MSEAVNENKTLRAAANAYSSVPWLAAIRSNVASHCASLGFQDDPWQTKAPAAAAGGGATDYEALEDASDAGDDFFGSGSGSGIAAH